MELVLFKVNLLRDTKIHDIMKRAKKLKIKYVYIEPKTPEEKIEQQRRLDDTYDILFDTVAKELLKNINNSERLK